MIQRPSSAMRSLRVPTRRQIGRRAHEGDAAVLRGDRATLDYAETGRHQRRQAGIEPDGVEAHTGRPRLPARSGIKTMGVRDASHDEGIVGAYLIISTTRCCRPAGRATCASMWRTARSRASRRTRRAKAPQHVSGLAIPGLPNLHCHAFQRGMAGLAERRGPAHDSFWTWREVMYRFLGRLTPDDVEAIAAFAYMQMLEAGFTAVGEFHYLHHDIDGRPYADLGEMAARIAAAAQRDRHRAHAAPHSLYARRLRRRGAERRAETLPQRSGPLRGAARALARDRARRCPMRASASRRIRCAP